MVDLARFQRTINTKRLIYQSLTLKQALFWLITPVFVNKPTLVS